MLKSFFIITFLFISINFAHAQEGIIHIDSSQDVKNLVIKKIKFNATKVAAKTYSIQLFYGSENGAERTLAKFRKLFTETSSNLEFDSPSWKVKVGNYKTRLQADKHLQEIIILFSDAIVLEPKK